MTYEWKRVSETQLPIGIRGDERMLKSVFSIFYLFLILIILFFRIPNYQLDYAGTYECDAILNGNRARGFLQVASNGADRMAAILRPLPPLTTTVTTSVQTTTPTSITSMTMTTTAQSTQSKCFIS